MAQDPILRWVDELAEARLPILQSTRELMARLAQDGRMSMREVGRALHRDPVMALTVMRMANARDRQRLRNELTTLEHSAMMLGIGRLAEEAARLPTVEALVPRAVQPHLRRVMARSSYASLLAESWARERRDMVPTEVALGALLYNLGELALWTRIPAQMAELALVKERCRVPIHEAEYVVLGFTLEPLSHALAERWALPPMVVESMQARYAQELRTLGVMLAAQLGRYAFGGWRDPYFVEDLDLAAQYLHLSLDDLLRQLNGLTSRFNDMAAYYGLPALIPLSQELVSAAWERLRSGSGRNLCLAPRRDLFRLGEQRLAARHGDPIAGLLEGLHHGLGLNRVVFARLGGDAELPVLAAEAMVGTDYEPRFNRFRLPLRGSGLFEALMGKPAAVWLNPGNEARLWPLVPEEVKALIGVRSFFAMSLFVGGRPLGLIYADRHSRACRLDERAFEGFKRLVGEARKALEAGAGG